MKAKYLLIPMVATIGGCGCATFKKIENNYCIHAENVIIDEAPQTVSGSDAQDSLNGNTPKLQYKGQ